MSRHAIPGLGKKKTLRNLLWLVGLVFAVAWIVTHPYEVRHGIDQFITFFTIVSGGDR